MDNLLNDKYFLRHNCDLLNNMLSLFDKTSLPPDIYSAVFDLMCACENFVGEGYSYHIIDLKDGDLDLEFSSPFTVATSS